jgi:hypothetical protein
MQEERDEGGVPAASQDTPTAAGGDPAALSVPTTYVSPPSPSRAHKHDRPRNRVLFYFMNFIIFLIEPNGVV